MVKQFMLLLALVSLWTAVGRAQQYTLSAPGIQFTSKAYLTDAKLDVIDSQGEVNTYVRDINYDSQDGQWKGYRSRQTGRVLRWPRSNSGNLQIGSEQRGEIQFTPSRMQIGLAVSSQANSLQPGSGGSSLGNPLSSPGSDALSNRPFSPDSLPGVQPGGDVFGGRGSTNDLPEYQVLDWSSFAKSDFFARTIQNPINRLPSPQPMHLVSYDSSGTPWAMTQRGARIGLTSQVNSQAMWWIAPAGPGIVRLQMQNSGQVWAVSADDQDALRLGLVSQDPRQLWRVSPAMQTNHYLLENAFYVGNYLTQLSGGNLGIQPILGTPAQMWVPLSPPANRMNMFQPFWRSVQREIRPNPPLPPAEIELLNTNRHAIMVLVGDLRSGQVMKEVRIEPAGASTITVDRDAGSTLVETVEIMSAGGGWNQQTYTTQIPPVSLYDLSVYEEFLQSIAIDRTGKSPNPIEDINVAPKSVGMLTLPPGKALPERGQMDVFAQASAARNPGAVRRMDPKRFEKPKPDPLESILEDLQKQQPKTNAPRSF